MEDQKLIPILERIDTKLGKLEQGQTRLETQVNKLETQVNKLEQGQTRLETQVNKLETQVNKLEQGQTRLETQVNKLEQGQTRLETQVNKLETQVSKLEQGQEKMQKTLHATFEQTGHNFEATSAIKREVLAIQAELAAIKKALKTKPDQGHWQILNTRVTVLEKNVHEILTR